jgi:hypothetical protein
MQRRVRRHVRAVSPPSDLAPSDQATENSPLTHLAEIVEFSSIIGVPLPEPVGSGSNPGPAASLKSMSGLAPLPCIPQNLTKE